ncbi:IS5 family transposase [Catenulispora yoronensis]|uniref:IS5 family transposase n=1 Tax=Catenulispora yoronensis TaxID=450799 RepID=A0ABN2VNU0_9ACTN
MFYGAAPGLGNEEGFSGVSCDCLAHRFGNAGDQPVRTPVYPTDLTDAQWAQVLPLVPVPAWMGGRGGRPEGYCHRIMIDAMLYVVDNGIKWRAMPADFPGWEAVYRFWRRWRDQHLLTVLHDRLRRACRVADGRDPEPSAAVIDSQSVKAAETVAATDRGFDAAKKVNGTKRHIAVDTSGLLLAVMVTGADVPDRDQGLPLLARLVQACPSVAKIWADGGYAGALVTIVAATLHLVLEIVRRPAGARGLVVLPRRWVVERTLAWLTRARRLARDYERRPESHEAMVQAAMLPVMTRRLARKPPTATH